MGFGRKDVHIDRPLTEFALSYLQDATTFIADKVLPVLKVSKESDKYFIFDRNSWRERSALRAAGAVSNRTNLPGLTTGTYSVEEYALHDMVSQREIDSADAALKPLQDATAEIAQQLMISKELSCARVAFTTTAAASTLAVSTTAQWGYTSSTTPIDQIRTAISTVGGQIGRDANQMTIGKEPFLTLQDHAQILDRIKWTQKGIVTSDIIASVLDLEKINVGRATYVSTAEGISETTAYIWGKNALISYVNPRPAVKAVTHGYTFANTGESIQVEQWWNKDHKAWKVEGTVYYDQKVCSTIAAYLLTAVIA